MSELDEYKAFCEKTVQTSPWGLHIKEVLAKTFPEKQGKVGRTNYISIYKFLRGGNRGATDYRKAISWGSICLNLLQSKSLPNLPRNLKLGARLSPSTHFLATDDFKAWTRIFFELNDNVGELAEKGKLSKYCGFNILLKLNTLDKDEYCNFPKLCDLLGITTRNVGDTLQPCLDLLEGLGFVFFKEKAKHKMNLFSLSDEARALFINTDVLSDELKEWPHRIDIIKG